MGEGEGKGSDREGKVKEDWKGVEYIGCRLFPSLPFTQMVSDRPSSSLSLLLHLRLSASLLPFYTRTGHPGVGGRRWRIHQHPEGSEVPRTLPRAAKNNRNGGKHSTHLPRPTPTRPAGSLEVSVHRAKPGNPARRQPQSYQTALHPFSSPIPCRTPPLTRTLRPFI